MHSRKLLDCLCAAVLTGIRVVGIPHKEQGLCMQGCSSLSVRGLIFSVFLVRQSVADPHYEVTCPWPAFNPDH